jgi:adenosylcobinamide-GDP ribazoletransferase
MELLRSFDISFSFLTVFRVSVDPPPTMEDVGKSAWAFPLVGAVIGAVLALVLWLCQGSLPPFLNAVTVVAVWVVITGGLHLDGWTDCWDALAAAVPPEVRRRILKDSRLGTFGALGLILLLLAKIGALANEGLPLIMVFIAPILGRVMMVLVAGSSEKSAAGMAAGFISGLDARSMVSAGVMGVVAAIIGGRQGILAAIVAYVVAVGFARLSRSRLGGINGDVIGACCELTETLVLVTACIRW